MCRHEDGGEGSRRAHRPYEGPRCGPGEHRGDWEDRRPEGRRWEEHGHPHGSREFREDRCPFEGENRPGPRVPGSVLGKLALCGRLAEQRRGNRRGQMHILRILKEEGVPRDMKYLCVIESSLTNATSPAGAQGYWQFMKATGARYGLEIGEEVDMRNDLVESTHAACQYLKYLKRRLGSWTNAAAAYNCGEGGLEKRLANQRQQSYYDLLLNKETQRYVYRILALKLILQHPKDYGYHVRRCDTYPELPCEQVELSGKDVDLVKFALDHGTSYKMLRTLNPWITTDRFKNKAGKSYKVLVPIKKGTEYTTITRGKHDTTLIESI